MQMGDDVVGILWALYIVVGTTRKNVLFVPLLVSAGSVADPDTAANPAVASKGPTASTSWLPDGPTTATAGEAMIDCVFVVAIDGVSCVSSCASVTWV